MTPDKNDSALPDWLQAIQHEPDLAMWSICEHCEETPADFHVPCPTRVQALIAAAQDRDRVRDQLGSFVARAAEAHGLPATSSPEAVIQRARVTLDAAHRANSERDTALDEAKRLRDLVRYARAELHGAGMLSDAEYASLAGASGAVERLLGYDALRREHDQLQRAAAGLKRQNVILLQILDAVPV